MSAPLNCSSLALSCMVVYVSTDGSPSVSHASPSVSHASPSVSHASPSVKEGSTPPHRRGRPSAQEGNSTIKILLIPLCLYLEKTSGNIYFVRKRTVMWEKSSLAGNKFNHVLQKLRSSQVRLAYTWDSPTFIVLRGSVLPVECVTDSLWLECKISGVLSVR
jgi:hypothetical protein